MRRRSVGSRPGSISDVLFPIGSEPMEERPSLLSKVADMQTGAHYCPPAMPFLTG